ncbi:MAG: DNA primase [Patescibacteria group bacterium]|nr:DNA primase [Patescibacteria group bacterium]
MANEIQQIKDKIDIVGLISQYVPLKKSGRNYKGLCPFHAEKTPSFMVSPELQIFKCFGCSEGGDIFAFLMKREGLEFKEALEELAKRAGVKLSSYSAPSNEDQRRGRLLSALSLSSRFYNYLLTEHPAGRVALKYLSGRGLTPETIKKFLLGFAPNEPDSLTRFLQKKGFSLPEITEAGLAFRSDRNNKFFDRFRGRVMFPLFDSRGQVIGFSGRLIKESGDAPKYLNSPETPVFSKSRFLFGFNLARPFIKKAGRAVLVEGQMDLISNVQAGVENAVATSGTALTADQLKMIKKLAPEVVFCFDADEAGQKALERSVELAEAEGLTSLVSPLPLGVKDPDEAAQKKLAEWQESLAKPLSFYDYYFNLNTANLLKSDALGKKRAADKLLPILSKIIDPLQKAHFVKKLAESLDLEERFVREALDKMVVPSDRAKAEDRLSYRVIEGLKGPKRAETLRRYVLCLLLRFDFSLGKRYIGKLAAKDFAGSETQPIFTRLKEVYNERERSFDPLAVKTGLAEEPARIFEELMLSDLGEFEEDKGLQEKELGAVAAELKKETLKSEVEVLLAEIRRAEKENEKEELKSLQVKLNNLYQKLKD